MQEELVLIPPALTRLISAVVLIIGLAACHQRRVLPVVPAPIVGATYIIQAQTKPNTYYIWLFTDKAADKRLAMQAIECGICAEQPAGIVIYVERFPQKGKP